MRCFIFFFLNGWRSPDLPRYSDGLLSYWSLLPPETEGAELSQAAEKVCLVTEADWSTGEGKSKVGLI